MRYALIFGYNGRNFSGYARQPGLKTIGGEIFRALEKTNIINPEINANLQTASRTDKGVSAIGNVLALDTNFRKEEILGALNAHLEDIWFYGLKEVEEKESKRTIDSIKISEKKDFIILDFKAQSYLWHMVRRIVKAITYAASRKITHDEIREALAAEQKIDFGIAAPGPLILMDVQYDFEFDIDGENFEKMKLTLQKELNDLKLESMIYEHLLEIEKRK